ncbi:MAG: AraC family transcriptional regulator, partial [Nitrospiraceae bacterium]
MMPLFASHTARVQDSLTERIQTFLTGNLRNRITLKELARFLGYSEKYSSEFFQLQMGTCFSHYLKRLRIMKAKHMLVGDGASVTHIAE